jgi:anthranilate phosphoribosyltransferase
MIQADTGSRSRRTAASSSDCHGAREVDRDAARAMLAAMLDGASAADELDALFRGYRTRGETIAELAGFVDALQQRIVHFDPPADSSRPIVLATYAGVRRQPNLTALLALLLRRYGVPVLLHGTAETVRHFGRVTTAAILWELGIEAARSAADAERALAGEGVAYVPIDVLAPGTNAVLAPKADPDAQMVIKLVDPFGGAGIRVVCVTRPEHLPRMRSFLSATGADALLLRGTEGEPFADPRRQPELEWFDRGVGNVLFDAESASRSASLPRSVDAPATAAWIAAALSGEAPIPQPVLNQLACCLHATRPATAG